METNRFIKYFTLATIVGMLIASPLFVFAYDDKTAHPALTDEIVDLFNLYYPNAKIDDKDKELIKNGSIGEDVDTRWMHHFYDPIYNRGLWGYSSSKVWALDSFGQASLDAGYIQGGSVLETVSTRPFDSRTDYSWDRAIYDYVWADKERGLEGLGHILHLLEDASVPDHTRNDAHPPILDFGSPYEFWTKRFTDKTTDGLALSIFNENLKPNTYKILQEPFYSLAKYSNENFFSKDTIFDKEYTNPTIDSIQVEKLSNQKNYKFGYKVVGIDKYRIVRIEKLLGDSSDNYSLLDKDNLILNDYWVRLSKQAVLHGTGVIKLFLEEAEKERTSKMRLSRNKSLLDKISSSVSSWFNDNDASLSLIAGLPSGAFDISTPSLNISGNALQTPQQTTTQNTSLNISNLSTTNQLDIATFNNNTSDVQQIIFDAQSQNILDNSTVSDQSFSVSPGFGGGETQQNKSQETTDNTLQELTTSGASDQGASSESENIQIETAPPDNTPPSAPIILEPIDSTIFTKTDILFRGTAEPLSIISQNLNLDTASTNASGTWELKLSIEKQGTSTIEFYSNDLAGNTSSSTPIIIFVDSEAPDILLSATQCGKSISPDSCLVATSTIALEWSSSAPDVNHFEIICIFNGAQCENFNFANTNATSTIYISKQGDGKYEFRAKTFDKLGNVSDEAVQEIYISNSPVIINEIAWAGSSANSADEWIELYNRTDKAVSLDGWVLYTKTNAPYIQLFGTIAPHSYYLMERADDNAVSDITADLIYGNDGASWALNNSSESVVLAYASTTIDETPVCYRGNQWCGGSASYLYQSMERVDSDIVGTVVTNWKSSMDEFIKNGKDAAGKALNATPKARNSANYLVSQNGSLTSDKT
ncbi:MAG: lamin tail domain-containing protein, partial [Patescibacteria group bacterium]